MSRFMQTGEARHSSSASTRFGKNSGSGHSGGYEGGAINSILNDPQQMQKVMEMAGQLMGNGGAARSRAAGGRAVARRDAPRSAETAGSTRNSQGLSPGGRSSRAFGRERARNLLGGGSGLGGLLGNGLGGLGRLLGGGGGRGRTHGPAFQPPRAPPAAAATKTLVSAQPYLSASRCSSTGRWSLQESCESRVPRHC